MAAARKGRAVGGAADRQARPTGAQRVVHRCDDGCRRRLRGRRPAVRLEANAAHSERRCRRRDPPDQRAHQSGAGGSEGEGDQARYLGQCRDGRAGEAARSAYAASRTRGRVPSLPTFRRQASRRSRPAPGRNRRAGSRRQRVASSGSQYRSRGCWRSKANAPAPAIGPTQGQQVRSGQRRAGLKHRDAAAMTKCSMRSVWIPFLRLLAAGCRTPE